MLDHNTCYRLKNGGLSAHKSVSDCKLLIHGLAFA